MLDKCFMDLSPGWILGVLWPMGLARCPVSQVGQTGYPLASPFILWYGFVAVGYTSSIRVYAHNHSVIIDCVGLRIDGSGRVYGDELPLPHEIAVLIDGQTFVRIVHSRIRPYDVSSFVNPASAGTNQAGAGKMDGLEFSWPVPHKSVKHAVGGVTEGTGQYSAVVLGHPHVLAGGAGDMDVMKCPILQEEAVVDSGGVEMTSYDVTRVVNHEPMYRMLPGN